MNRLKAIVVGQFAAYWLIVAVILVAARDLYDAISRSLVGECFADFSSVGTVGRQFTAAMAYSNNAGR